MHSGLGHPHPKHARQADLIAACHAAHCQATQTRQSISAMLARASALRALATHIIRMGDQSWPESASLPMQHRRPRRAGSLH